MYRRPLIFVVTGERGSGKSTVCARVARETAQQGLAVAGILTERTDSDDPRGMRKVIDLQTGEERAFGSQEKSRRRSAQRPVKGTVPTSLLHETDKLRADVSVDHTSTSDPLTPGWRFDPDVFFWANEVLTRSIPCDLLIVDEVGPLELLGGRGWAKATEVLRSSGYHAALVVCRFALLDELRRILGSRPGVVVEVTPETRDLIPTAIMERIQSPD